jgi:hypothetical protein
MAFHVKRQASLSKCGLFGPKAQNLISDATQCCLTFSSGEHCKSQVEQYVASTGEGFAIPDVNCGACTIAEIGRQLPQAGKISSDV